MPKLLVSHLPHDNHDRATAADALSTSIKERRMYYR